MKKYIILSFMLLGLWGTATAQEGGTGPAAGDISVAVLLGQGNFFTGGLQVPGSPGSGYWVIPGTAPYANMVEENYNSFVNMAGGELRYFVTNNMAVRLTGGMIIRQTPARDNVPGIIDPSAPNVTWIPDFAAVVGDKEMMGNVALGFEYQFATKVNRLFPYLGVAVPFAYSRKSEYNPYYNVDDQGNVTVTDVAERHVQVVAFGGQLVSGVDYYLTEGLYLGFEIKPFSIIYSYNEKFPAPGLESMKADNYTYGVFSQPYLKIGFKF